MITVKLELVGSDRAPDHAAEATVPDRQRVREVLRRRREHHLQRPFLLCCRRSPFPPCRLGRLRRPKFADAVGRVPVHAAEVARTDGGKWFGPWSGVDGERVGLGRVG